MAEDQIPTIVTILLGGGGVVTLFSILFNYLSKKRESELEMSKFRIGEINKKYSDYMTLSSHSKRVSMYLEQYEVMTNYNRVKTFVSILKMLQTITKINRTGSFLLGHQQAESVLDILANRISMNFGFVFQGFDYTKFRDLNSESSFHVIDSKIKTIDSEYKKYFDMLWDWLLVNDIPQNDPKYEKIKQERSEMIRNIKIMSMCIGKLLPFEINMVFSDWYGKGFNKETYLPEDVKRHLYHEKLFVVDNEPALLSVAYPEYFDRIRQS